ARAQNPSIAVHPKPADFAKALEAVDVILTMIDEPFAVLSSKFDRQAGSARRWQMIGSVRDLSRRWAALITVSDGKQMPIASDLFFIYTQVNDIQSYISSVTSEERLRGQSSSILNAATTVLRAGTELLPIG